MMGKKKDAPKQDLRDKGIMTPEEFYRKIHKNDKDAIINLSEKKTLDFIRTGSWPIDQIIGDGSMKDRQGGFPRGQIVEIFGGESSGKSTLALSAIQSAQREGGFCILLDFEQTFHPKYAEHLGVSLDKNKFMLSQPMHFQQGARIINDVLATRPALIVVDSVTAMTPKEVMEGSVDEAGRPGLQAQLMSTFLGYITKHLKAANTCLVFTNQIRAIINMGFVAPGAPTETSSGGNALKFYSSVRLKMKQSKVEKVERISTITGKMEKEPVNVTVWVSVVKNKIDKPFRSAPVYIRFGEGFDNIQSIIDLGVNTNTIKRSGALYTFSDGDEQIFKVQGKKELWQLLADSPKIQDKIAANINIEEDSEVREEFAEESETGGDVDALLNNVSSAYVEKQSKKKAAKEAVTEDE